VNIITPSSAAFSPSGPSGGGISYTLSGVATVDVAVGPFSIGSISQAGAYFFTLTHVTTNTTAATGGLDSTVVIPAYAGPNNNSTALIANGVLGIGGLIWADLGTVTLEYNITAFTTGSADFKIIASLVKLF
jgi:hypothetical protein